MVKDNFNPPTPKRTQFDPGRVFSGIAIAALNPEHKYAYKTSCYAYVARAMREGKVLDTDEIILVGYKGQSNHAFVVRNGVAVIDSFSAVGTFDYDSGRYTAPSRALGSEGFTLSAKITFAEFKQRYNSETLQYIPKGQEFPEPS